MNHGTRNPLETAEPIDGLHVIGIGPESVESVVGADGDVRVVAEEGATELVASVDAVGGDRVRHVGGQVADDVIEARVVNVFPESFAVNAAERGRTESRAGLPGRDYIRGVGGQVDMSGRRRHGYGREEGRRGAARGRSRCCHQAE